MVKILHLSDLHFGCEKNCGTFINDFFENINLWGIAHVDLVIISGDLAFQNKYSECKEDLKSFFTRLREKFDWEDFEHFVVCPGNHDFKRTNCSVTAKHFQNKLKNELNKTRNIKFEDIFNEKSLEFLELKKRFNEYTTFCEENNLPKYKVDGMKYNYLVGKRSLKIGQINLNLVCINTAWFSQFCDVKNKYSVEKMGLVLGANHISAISESISKDSAHYTLTVLHHPSSYWNETEHLHLTENDQNSMQQITAFSDIVFHGHTHELSTISWHGKDAVPFIGTCQFFSHATVDRGFSVYDIDFSTASGSISLYTYHADWQKISGTQVFHLPKNRHNIFKRPFEKDNNKVYGRDKIVKEIVKEIKDNNCNAYIVYGAPGIGKTSVCKQVLNQFLLSDKKNSSNPADDYKPLCINSRKELDGFDDFLKIMCNELQLPESSDIEIIYRTLRENCKGTKTLLYLDNFEEALRSSKQILKSEPLVDTKELALHNIDPRVYNFLNECANIESLKLLISSRENICKKGYNISGKLIECFEKDAAYEMFQAKWGAQSVTTYLHTNEEKNRDILGNFISDALGNHPLSIEFACKPEGLKGQYSLHELIETWDEGILSDVKTQATIKSPHDNLNDALWRSYLLANKKRYACEIWALFTYFPEGIGTSIFEEFFKSDPKIDKKRIDEISDAKDYLLHLNLLYEDKDDKDDKEKLRMLAPFRQKIWSFTGDFSELESFAIDNLTRYYEAYLQESYGNSEENAELKEKRAELKVKARKLLPNIFFFMDTLLKSKRFTQLLKIHRVMSYFYQFFPQRSEKFLSKLLEQYKSIMTSKEQYAYTLWIYGDMLRQLHDVDLAEIQYKRAKKIYDEIINNNNKNNDALWGRAQTQRRIYDLGRVSGTETGAAQKKLTDLAKKYSEVNDEIGKANAIKILADYKRKNEDPSQAIAKYEEALELYKNSHDKDGEASALSWLAELAWRHEKNYRKAKKHFDDAKAVYEETKNVRGLANIYHGFGDLNQELKMNNEALLNYEKALKNYQNDAARIGEICVYGEMCLIYARQKSRTEVEEMIRKINELLIKSEHSGIRSNIFQYVSDCKALAIKILNNEDVDSTDVLKKVSDKLKIPRDFAKYTEGRAPYTDALSPLDV